MLFSANAGKLPRYEGGKKSSMQQGKKKIENFRLPWGKTARLDCIHNENNPSWWMMWKLKSIAYLIPCLVGKEGKYQKLSFSIVPLIFLLDFSPTTSSGEKRKSCESEGGKNIFRLLFALITFPCNCLRCFSCFPASPGGAFSLY